jgi:uroporphyrinogen III methyltransferase / synthase
MGKVYIIGAGPGDISHLTLRAQQLLASADVVIYDALVDDGLLQFLPAHCERVYVGKRGGQTSITQTEINQILVDHAQHADRGASQNEYRVVRLKSGDPFIFGRTTSEVDALMMANCPYEVIPGISAALAAPLLAGIPLTDTVLSYGFAVVTAHAPEELHWDALVQIPTVVILMGASTLAATVKGLIDHGKSPQTPIAIIKWASLPQQEVVVSDLGHIVSMVADRNMSPAVMVIGEVVKLRPFLRCDRRSPLRDKTVLITRSLQQSPELQQLLAAQGARTIEMPTLEIAPPSDWAGLDQAITKIGEYDWLILTSANGVEYFFDRLAAQHQDARALAGVKIAVVGRKTADTLQRQGILADFVPTEFIADALVDSFPESLTAKRVLFPRVESGGRELLMQAFTAAGAQVDEVAAYQSICPTAADPAALLALQRREIDIITFASSKTVQHFHQLVAANLPKDWSNNLLIASIGPQTSTTCQELFGRVDVEATEYTMPGLVAAIVATLQESRALEQATNNS